MRDTRIGEIDLGAARVTDLRFCRAGVDRLIVQDAVLDGVDLRGAEIAALEGVQALAGAVINESQLAGLAPALAASLGIRVAPDEAP